MKERPILMSAPMVRAILDGLNGKRKLYALRGADPNSPEHLVRRLANGIDEPREDGCWNWTRTTNGSGYGMLTVAGRMVYAHRLAYELARVSGDRHRRYGQDQRRSRSFEIKVGSAQKGSGINGHRFDQTRGP